MTTAFALAALLATTIAHAESVPRLEPAWEGSAADRPELTVKGARWLWRKTPAPVGTPVLRAELAVALSSGARLAGVVADGGDVVRSSADGRFTVDLLSENARLGVRITTGAATAELTAKLRASYSQTYLITNRACPHVRVRPVAKVRQARHLFLGVVCAESATGADVTLVKSQDAGWLKPSGLESDAWLAHVAKPRDHESREALASAQLRDARGELADYVIDYEGERRAFYWLEAHPTGYFTSETVTDRSAGNSQVDVGTKAAFALEARIGRDWSNGWGLFVYGEGLVENYPGTASGRQLLQESSWLGRTGVGARLRILPRWLLTYDLGFSQQLVFTPRTTTLLSVNEIGLARLRLTAAYDWVIKNSLGAGVELTGGYLAPRDAGDYAVNSSFLYAARLVFKGIEDPWPGHPTLDGGFFFGKTFLNTSLTSQSTTDVGIEIRLNFAL